MTIATKLSEARKLIERGWCQGVSQLGDSYCLIGACAAVTAAGGEPVYYAMRDALVKATGEHWLTDWNDNSKRTQAEVIEAFKRAEQLARDGAE